MSTLDLENPTVPLYETSSQGRSHYIMLGLTIITGMFTAFFIGMSILFQFTEEGEAKLWASIAMSVMVATAGATTVFTVFKGFRRITAMVVTFIVTLLHSVPIIFQFGGDLIETYCIVVIVATLVLKALSLKNDNTGTGNMEWKDEKHYVTFVIIFGRTLVEFCCAIMILAGDVDDTTRNYGYAYLVMSVLLPAEVEICAVIGFILSCVCGSVAEHFKIKLNMNKVTKVCIAILATIVHISYYAIPLIIGDNNNDLVTAFRSASIALSSIAFVTGVQDL